jgi:tetratricopeptide (TPR) repeat protein
MEKNTNTTDSLKLIQKQLDQLEQKVREDKKTKWYKNPSLILSIVALSSSLYFSITSIIEDRKQKMENRTYSTITSVKNSIEELVEEEEKYMKVPSTDISIKNNASLTYEAKTSTLIDKISKMADNNIINNLEPNLLLSYGRFLSYKGKFKEATKILESAIKKSDDTVTLGICYRTLANIYSNPSHSGFDSLKGREYRRIDINLANTFFGEARNIYLSRSYELWSLDEYYFIKNIFLGNKLLDSAKYVTSLFSDININKKIILNRLNEIYNYYNGILIPTNLNGEYSFYASDGKKGTAYVSINNNGVFLNIDFINNDELFGRLKGSGNVVDLNRIKFDVSTEFVEYTGAMPKYSAGTLTLETSKGYKLVGSFFEFGKKPIKYILVKK